MLMSRAFDVAPLLKLVAERFEQARLQILRKNPDTICFLLLGARFEGPHDGTGEQCDELASLHADPIPRLAL